MKAQLEWPQRCPPYRAAVMTWLESVARKTAGMAWLEPAADLV